MNKKLILDVKKKKEFSLLPDSIVERALALSEFDLKATRAFLRKYFGVFLINKVFKGKDENVLKFHLSTRKRDYDDLYKKLFSYEKFKSIIDLGCGVNGFSYNFLRKYFGDVNYIGVEAVGQIVENTNKYFQVMGFENAILLKKDLFYFDFKFLKQIEGPKFVFLFQVADALEIFEKNFTKKFLLNLKNILEEKDKIVLSVPLKSLSSGLKKASGKWAFEFIKEHFYVFDEFEMFDERFIVFGNGKN